ncbi:MAG: NYN domain-containing protein [Firmicutes bacterium]|nr:NYN domain-containing protein [Bacillota bacterium]
MEYLLVDGYNIINAWKDVFDLNRESLEECREKLLYMLSNYEGYKRIKIIVVFDAHLVSGSKKKVEKYDNIIVVFTGENQTADNYIERFVYKLGNEHTIRVATSDYLEQTIVLRNGGARMTPRELRKEIEDAHRSMIKDFSKNQYSEKNTIMSNIKPELADLLEKIRRSKL